MARRPPSLILGKVLFNGSTSCLFHPKAFQSAFTLRLRHCRSSIFFQRKRRTHFRLIGLWIWTNNPKQTPRTHSNQSNTSLHSRLGLSCSRRTQVFPTWWEPCFIIHGDGWFKLRAFYSQLALVGRVRVERTSSDFQSGAPTLYATDPF